MKPLLTLTIITILGFSFIKPKTFTPPGTIQINDTLFADQTEVTNFAWQEYEFYIKEMYGKNSLQYLATLPDTLVWRNQLSYNEPYVKYYYRHPAYKDYPVVGISYEQALAYCNWRTNRVKTILSIKKEYKNFNIEYRLPTKQEWEFFATTNVSVFTNNGKTQKNQFALNCIFPNDTTKDGFKIEAADVTAPVISYWKNSLGLYNTAGNVAEMILQKGISKGGSWRDKIEKCRPGIDTEYTKPESWLGFRCVCVKSKMAV